MTAIPRGITNNNPMNLRHGQPWQGLAAQQNDPEFCQFTNVEFGIRAGAVTLLNYQKLDGCNTIEQIINRYAPPSDDNPTIQYALNVAKACGVGITDIVSVQTLLPLLIPAIIMQEVGTAYPADIIALGIGLAEEP